MTDREIVWGEAPQNTPVGPARSVRLTPATMFQMRPVRWLWDTLLALGTLALLAGREGVGKSLVSFTVAAALTRGRLPGRYFGIPRSVIISASEDVWEFTILPRLVAADADLQRIFRIDVKTAAGFEAELSLPVDLADVKRLAEEVSAVLLICDPLLSRLDSRIDTHKDGDVRVALEPLVKLASETGMAVLGVIHVNKSTSTDALSTVMASRAFVAVARTVLFAMIDDADPTQRLLFLAKSNLGSCDVPARPFRITSHLVASTDEGDIWTGRLGWLEPVNRSLQDALSNQMATVKDHESGADETAEWMRRYLHSMGGSADSREVKKEAKAEGHSDRAVRRARGALNLLVTNTPTVPTRTVWALPVPVGTSAGESVLTNTTDTTRETSRLVKAVMSAGTDRPVSVTTAPFNPKGAFGPS